MTAQRYGEPPMFFGSHEFPDWHEFTHWLYLPVVMEGLSVRLPRQLELMRQMIYDIIQVEFDLYDKQWRYVYLTVRRGFASPDNPLNRPGWHTDGFGGEDINYIWSDRFPTRFAQQDFDGIDSSHAKSMDQFEHQVKADSVVTYPDGSLLRLNPFVVHATPEIVGPGGMRSFFKVSFSNHRYALKGNAHNYEFDYDWPLVERTEVRNDPQSAGLDYKEANPS